MEPDAHGNLVEGLLSTDGKKTTLTILCRGDEGRKGGAELARTMPRRYLEKTNLPEERR
jgi:hypothetical protein